jgi:hypothetical protein
VVLELAASYLLAFVLCYAMLCCVGLSAATAVAAAVLLCD